VSLSANNLKLLFVQQI